MGTIRNIVTASILATGLTVGAAATAGAAPIPAASPVTSGYSQAITDFGVLPYPHGIVQFDQDETAHLVQAGAAGAAAWAAGTVPNPLIKGAIAAAGVIFFFSARDALESSGNPCLTVFWTPFTGLQYEGVPCRTGGGTEGGFGGGGGSRGF